MSQTIGSEIKFAQLFEGRKDCFGIYTVTAQRGDGKQTGGGITYREPLEDSLYASHLAGETMLGVVPIRVDGTVSWFAGDIDEYNLDVQKLNAKIIEHELPLVLCVSKSGGAHLYAFVAGTIEAAKARNLLRLWLTKLGYPKAEIFPKQDHVSPSDTGNWINLPYYGGDLTPRYALGVNGEKLTLKEFEQLAYARSIRPGDVDHYFNKPSKKPPRGEFADAPPCVAEMMESGVTDRRNISLFHVGVYYRKSDDDNWKERIVEANEKMFAGNVLDDAEVNTIISNLSKRDYQYLCSEEPMASICDKETCLKRKWGVGPQQGLGFDSHDDIIKITKYKADPPWYLVMVEGGETAIFESRHMEVQADFIRRVSEAFTKFLPRLKGKDWDKQKLSYMRNMDITEVPKETEPTGRIDDAFKKFASVTIPRAFNIISINDGNAFYQIEQNLILFKFSSLSSWLDTEASSVKRGEQYKYLHRMGFFQRVLAINGKSVRVWALFCGEDDIWFDLPKKEQF